MIDLRKAAEMALEALEANDKLINGTKTHGGLVFAMDGYYSGTFDIDETNQQTEQAITALRQALAQPVDNVYISEKRVHKTEKSIHEPVAWMVDNDGNKYEIPEPNKGPLLKAMEREWVGLTDEEIESELTKEFAQWWSRHVSVCRAIEAKLKEKNAND